MSRKPRIYSNAQVYHVILRGNNKQILFYDDSDRLYLLTHLKKYAGDLKIELFSYCLMSNHVHLLIGNATPTISLFIQKLATSYAMYFNRKYERSGHLFHGRFKSEPVESNEYFKTVLRYILQNPLKATSCNFETYKWSSYAETLDSNCSTIIAKDYIYNVFSSKDNYLEFVRSINNDTCMEYENKFFLSDTHCIQLIKNLFNLKRPDILNTKSKKVQLKSVKQLKVLGMNSTQIARITGIPKKLINIA